MAFCYVTEYKYTPSFAYSAPATKSAIEHDAIAVGGSSTQSSWTFDANTTYIRVNVDVATCIAWGDDPTAVDTQHRLGPNETGFYNVVPGQKIAVIAAPA